MKTLTVLITLMILSLLAAIILDNMLVFVICVPVLAVIGLASIQFEFSH